MAAEAPSLPPEPSSPPQEVRLQTQYWCYHCEKRVRVETQPGQPDDVICSECKFGFVESIPGSTATTFSSAATLSPPDHIGISDEPTLGNQFLAVLHLLAQVARDDDVPPPPPPSRPVNPTDPLPSDESDFLRIEIEGWDEENENHRSNNDNNDEDEDDDEDDDDVRSVEIEGQSDDDGVEENRVENIRRRRHDVLRLRLRDFANRARSEGNMLLDWAEILRRLEDNSIPETTDRYIGNPGDYVDAAEYEALLQNLADAEGRRGAPPAVKSAVESLKVVEIKSVNENYLCAICKDGVSVGDVVKEMPCGHRYHGDCIVPWLASRNSCPVCRFELPTDDADYEEERKKRFPGSSSGGIGTSL